MSCPLRIFITEHRIIFESIVGLIDENKPADVVTVYQALKSQGVDEQCGGIAYLNRLAQATPGVAHRSAVRKNSQRPVNSA